MLSSATRRAPGNRPNIGSDSGFALKRIMTPRCLEGSMGEAERVVKRSCPLCQHASRDELENALLLGEISPQQLDRDMGWRLNTTDRHFRNHMGQYHMAANPQCKVCAHPQRADFEQRYFADGAESEAIAAELGIREESVYHHMKHHFQPLVQRSAVAEVTVLVGREVDVLRSNVERLNHKLSELLDEGSVHEDGFVRDAVSLHKEVRESVKDLVRMQETWGATTENNEIHNTINILKVELGKESPETWARLREKLITDMEGFSE
tara:strand:+ start:441 stop:1235 length:795 start_codon:yes stop_codon:yes gene_type:complete